MYNHERRWIWVTLCVIGMLALFPAAVFAEIPAVVRVGLESKYKDVGSVTVNCQAAGLSTWADGGSDFGALTGSGAFRVSPSSAYFVEADSGYPSLVGALDAATAFRNFGYKAVPACKAWGVSVYLGPYGSKADADAAADAVSGTVAPAAARALMYDGDSLVAVLEGGVQITNAAGSAVSLGERSYRGGIGFIVSGDRLTAVNILSLDEYLYSAVPSEMPSHWPLEALKAQAVAGRTYALTRMTAHQDAGYHFCDRTHCQSYLGAGNESESAIAAVDATSGVIALYNGEPINAVYSSSSGGYTEASENAWTEVVPYLRAVEDPLEVSGMTWERKFSLGQIQSLLDVNIGTVTKVYVGKTAPSGRVQELVVQGTGGSKTLTKEGIRTFFSGSAGGMLESRNFHMQGASASTVPTQIAVADAANTVSAAITELYAISSTGEIVRLPSQTSVAGRDGQMVYKASTGVVSGGSSVGDSAVFTGSGWGHGVGMSQYGAKDMAEAGYDYIQILKHYYTGIEVR